MLHYVFSDSKYVDFCKRNYQVRWLWKERVNERLYCNIGTGWYMECNVLWNLPQHEGSIYTTRGIIQCTLTL